MPEVGAGGQFLEHRTPLLRRQILEGGHPIVGLPERHVGLLGLGSEDLVLTPVRQGRIEVPRPSACPDGGPVLGFPGLVVSTVERLGIVDLDWNDDPAAWAHIEPEPGVGFPTPGQDKHHGPIASAEDAVEGLFVNAARGRTAAGMRMDPHAGKLLRPPAEVHLEVEEVGHGLVIERDAGGGGLLGNADEVLDVERVIFDRDAEAPDLSLAAVTEEQEFGPGRG